MPQTDPDEWGGFTRETVAAGRWTWFPKVVELLDALREYRGRPSLEAEAIVAYERVTKSAEYTPEGGATWNFRRVLDTCGRAAADAFLEAGGHWAFATTWDESKCRERFIAAYQQEARETPETRLLPAKPEERPQLAAAPNQAEAESFVAKVAEHAGVKPQPRPEAKAVVGRDMTDQQLHDRVALLKRQAEQMATPVAEEA